MAPSPVIRCVDVTKRYRETVALAGVSLEVSESSVFGFLGPNGAGKSTLVKILTGLVLPSGGEVGVLGGRPGTRAVQTHVGYLPEHFRFPAWLTGRELVEFHARLLGVPAEAQRLLDLVGVSKTAAQRRLGEYSKGMQQRLGLAQALVGDPRLVFLDEPTSALDPVGRTEIRDVLLHLRERGTTVFLNSHLLTEVEQVCDQVAVIDQGVVIAQGTIESMLQTPLVQIRIGEQPAERVAGALQVLTRGSASAAGSDGAPSYSDGRITVAVASVEDVPRYIETLVEAGLPIYEVGLVRRSLEETFLRLLQEHEEGPRRPPAGGRIRGAGVTVGTAERVRRG